MIKTEAMAFYPQQGMTYFGAVQGVKVKGGLLSRVHGLNVQVVPWVVSSSNCIVQVVGGMAVPHLELAGALCLVICHVLGA